jgi:hypothetical protein
MLTLKINCNREADVDVSVTPQPDFRKASTIIAARREFDAFLQIHNLNSQRAIHTRGN